MPNTLTDFYITFLALSRAEQRRVHVYCCERAVAVWENAYQRGEIPHSYMETVVGTEQHVEPDLPRHVYTYLSLYALDTLDNLADSVDPIHTERIKQLQKRYWEPLTALQDDDLQLSDRAEFAYYAVYNTFRYYTEPRFQQQPDPKHAWLIVEQTLSALEVTEYKDVLSDFLKNLPK